MQPHTVIAILEAKQGEEEKLKAALTKVIAPSRDEAGCIEYRLHQDKQNPARFIFFEVWENEAVHQEQFQKPYILELGSIAEDLLAKPYEVFFAHELD